jgi:cytochrome c biogenesis protein
MVLIAAACTVGTLIKQQPYDPAQAVAQYGKPLGLLIGLLGLHQLYHTWWFLGLLVLFALSTVACALPRLRLSPRSLGSAVVHLSIVFIVAGALVRGIWGVDGVVQIHEGHAVDSFQTTGGNTVDLGFQLRLNDFEIERYENHGDVLLVQAEGHDTPQEIPVQVGRKVNLNGDGSTAEILRYVPHFVFRFEDKKVISASQEPVNPAIKVRVTTPEGESSRWLFARFPDPHGGKEVSGPQLRYVHRQGPVKTFASHVTVLDDAGEARKSATILVNQPLEAGRFTFYQASYDQRTERTTVLEVGYDPGVPLVFTGFILMPLGIAYVFYIQPLLRRKARRDV